LAVLGAQLFITARSLDTADAPGTPASADPAKLSPTDRETLAEVDAALTTQLGESSSTVTSTPAKVTAAFAFVPGGAEVPTVTASSDDALRTSALDSLGATAAQGAAIWPPTRQTAVQRFGSWIEALKAAGLATNRVGRAKGALRFAAAAYDRAIAEFLGDCESRGVGATYKAYTEYAAEHKGEVPSAAAVRKFYGSWNAALAAVE